MDNLSLKSLNPPRLPGVYIMKNKTGEILYIGKAKNLRNRVNSYFNNSKTNARIHIRYLVDQIYDIEFIVTKNERDALILENSLIKKRKPKYNIQFKDDKSYFSLKLDIKEDFPRLYFTRSIKDDGALYFGPFTSTDSLKKAKRIFHKLFPLRDCTNSKFKRHVLRPCINYNMKLCSGPCASKVSLDEYQSIVRQARFYLKGKFREIIKILERSMKNASDETRFEEAATYRNQLRFLKMHIDERGLINSSVKDRDIIGLDNHSSACSIVILFYRNGSIVDKTEFFFTQLLGNSEQILEEFLLRYYSFTNTFPKEINIPYKLKNICLIEEWINKKSLYKVKFFSPKRGKRAEQLQLAFENAKNCFERNYASNRSFEKISENIKIKLKLKKLPNTIECFDISNIQGTNPVASLVRFENGNPLKRKYKRYKIKSVTGSNDIAMMREVISRRLNRYNQKGWDISDMILIDGGVGQLNSALKAAEEFGLLKDIDIISIAKGRLSEETDKIYIRDEKRPVVFRKNSEELLYLMRIRDEAHRFAITFHKSLRKKRFISSEYESVPNVGKKRKIILQKHFGKLRNLKEVAIEDIASIKGLNLVVAKSIRDYLNSFNV